MRKTHIPFYETYEDAKNRDESKLHYFKVVSETLDTCWYDCHDFSVYLLVDESNPDNMIVASYVDDYGFVPNKMSVQQFLNLKYDNDMHRLIANNR